jgi:GntR family transcriptional regulator
VVRKNVPLAQQVVNEILTGIDNGSLSKENGLLLSEAELCRRFEVSRSTIREALTRLEQRGVVVRRHGVGTFIVQQPLLESGLERLESIFTIARRMGLHTSIGDADICERPATAAEAQKLEIILEKPILSVQRVILTDDRPVAFLIDVLSTEYLSKEILSPRFSGSVLDILIERGEPALSISRTEIYTTRADGSIARKLNQLPGDMLLVLEAYLFSREGHVIDYSLSYFVPDFFRFRVVRRIDPCDTKAPGLEVVGDPKR